MATPPDAASVPTPDGPMPAVLWLPPAGTGPGLVVLQEIFGVSDYIAARCADLAAEGYVVLAPELYWRLGERHVPDDAPDLLEQGMALAGRIDWDLAVQDAVAALAELRARPETDGRAGVVGFCFGGGLAFHVAAVSEPDVLVSYYGSALPQLLHLAERVTTPSLHHFGTEDAYLPADTVAEIEQSIARPGVDVHLHEGAGHAFDNPHPLFHHRDASRTAWTITTAWLADHLPPA